MVTVEPILDFDLDTFVDGIVSISPKAVFIGYNSHPTKCLFQNQRKRKHGN